MTTLTRRRDFVAASRARRKATPGFTLQARRRRAEEVQPDEVRANEGAPAIRVGYTCSRKVGNAVARNRAKRRLREIARAEFAVHGRPGWDYVLVGRAGETARRDFVLMRQELRGALAALHERGA